MLEVLETVIPADHQLAIANRRFGGLHPNRETRQLATVSC